MRAAPLARRTELRIVRWGRFGAPTNVALAVAAVIFGGSAIALTSAGERAGAGDAKTSSPARLERGDVAVVGQVHITKALLRSAERVVASQIRSERKVALRGRMLQNEALRILIQGAEQAEAAELRGIRVTDEMVKSRIAAVRRAYFHNSEAAYAAELKRERISIGDVRAEVRADLVSQLLESNVSAASGDHDKVRAMTNWLSATTASYCAQRKIIVRSAFNLDPAPCSL